MRACGTGMKKGGAVARAARFFLSLVDQPYLAKPYFDWASR